MFISVLCWMECRSLGHVKTPFLHNFYQVSLIHLCCSYTFCCSQSRSRWADEFDTWCCCWVEAASYCAMRTWRLVGQVGVSRVNSSWVRWPNIGYRWEEKDATIDHVIVKALENCVTVLLARYGIHVVILKQMLNVLLNCLTTLSLHPPPSPSLWPARGTLAVQTWHE